jgi:retinol dehydrogenase-12
LLAAGAASSPDGKARVINTASSAADSGSGINFNTFRDSQTRTKKGTHYLYFQSKLGNVLVSNAMARKWAADNIISVSLNPGNLKSELQRHSSSLVKFVFVSDHQRTQVCHKLTLTLPQDLITYPAHFGALTQLWAGTSAEGVGFNGKYLWPWARVGKCAPQAADEKLQDEVWKWLEEQVKDV